MDHGVNAGTWYRQEVTRTNRPIVAEETYKNGKVVSRIEHPSAEEARNIPREKTDVERGLEAFGRHLEQMSPEEREQLHIDVMKKMREEDMANVPPPARDPAADRKVITQYLTMLEDKDEEKRMNAILFLGPLGSLYPDKASKEIVPAFEKILKNKTQTMETKESVVMSLRQIGTNEAKRVLVEYAKTQK